VRASGRRGWESRGKGGDCRFTSDQDGGREGGPAEGAEWGWGEGKNGREGASELRRVMAGGSARYCGLSSLCSDGVAWHTRAKKSYIFIVSN